MDYRFDKVKPEYFDSIKAYRDEFIACDSEFDGCSQLEKYDDIEKWYLNNRLFESKDTVPPGYAIGFEYLYLDGDEVIGMVNLRPEIENHPGLREYGGNIGYSVKPSKRGLGVATSMLRDFLPICKQYGLKKVMISCMAYNDASRKVILNNGGVYERSVPYPPENELLERYWIEIK